MELDYSGIKALASPTRISILSELMDDTATPTQLSSQVGKTKSTVTSHLDTLVDAGLVEKDDVEGRRRVVYRPTRKAQTIVKGRKTMFRFSIGTAVLVAGAGAVFTWMNGLFAGSGGQVAQATAQMEAMDAAGETAAQEAASLDPVTVGAGIGFMLLAGILVYAAVMVYRLPDIADE